MTLFEETELLRIAFEVEGPPNGPAVFLLHGWPDAPMGWKQVASELHRCGYKTVAPWLRGSYPTEFRSEATPRFGSFVAMAQDVIDLADRLGLRRFAVLGHDWGARIAYTLAALFPERTRAIAALALPYPVRGQFTLGSFVQSKHFWYQFFQCTDAGADAIRHDPVGFARIQWETWSPVGWFTEEDFMDASRHFGHPDWVRITLNAYRARYLQGEVIDHRYDHLTKRIAETLTIKIPTLMIQGASDFCDLPSASEGQERFFLNGYERLLLDGVGHFPHREAPAVVAAAATRLLESLGKEESD